MQVRTSLPQYRERDHAASATPPRTAAAHSTRSSSYRQRPSTDTSPPDSSRSRISSFTADSERAARGEAGGIGMRAVYGRGLTTASTRSS